MTDPTIIQAWNDRATDLACFVDEHLVNRRDAWGNYLPFAERTDTRKAKTKKGDLNLAVLERHFKGVEVGDVIGLHTTSPDQTCRWCGIDLDQHNEDAVDGRKEANFRVVLTLCDRLKQHGMSPLLIDSNGNGGYHIWVYFTIPVATSVVYAYISSVVADWQAMGLEEPPETFPKQAQIGAGGFGNWLRLPGRHHTRDHYTRVWDDESEQWLEGEDAIDAILSWRSSPPPEAPREESSPANEPKPTPPAVLPPMTERIKRARAYVEKVPAGLVDGQRQKPAYYLSAKLRHDFALDEDSAVVLLLEWDTRNKEPLGEAELRSLAKNAGAYGKESIGSAYAQNLNAECDEEGVPEICLNVGDLKTLTEEAWKAIGRFNNPPTVFLFVGVPHRMERDNDSAPVLRAMTKQRMRNCLASAAKWFVWKGSGEDKRRQYAYPHDALVENVLASPVIPLPVLTRIVSAPIFSLEGCLSTVPGYDIHTQTFLDLAPSLKIPSVSETPTQAEIQRAKALILDDLLVDFPFTGDTEKAHAVGLLVLPFVREMIPGATPFHLIEKPAQGTGATLLAELVEICFLGRIPPPITEARTEEEMRKKLTALLMGAPSIVLLDNISNKMCSTALVVMLTSTNWSDRLLGASEMVNVSSGCVWVGTGNNPVLSNDMLRRVVRIRMDARQEEPWRRRMDEFKHQDIRQWARDHRGELIWAVCTLVKAWLAAGRPAGKVTLGSFENWSQVIGGILDVAGIPGFLGNLDDLYEHSDSEVESFRGFVTAWFETHGSKPVKVAELYEIANQEDLNLDLGDKGDQSRRVRLANLLGQNRDRWFNLALATGQVSVRVARGEKKSGAYQWFLEVCEIPLRESRESRESLQPRAREKSTGGNDNVIYENAETDSQDSRDSRNPLPGDQNAASMDECNTRERFEL